MLTRRDFLKAAAAASSLGLVGPFSLLSAETGAGTRYFKGGGQTPSGNWHAEVRFSPGIWKPGRPLIIDVVLKMESALLPNIAATGIAVKSLLLLVTAERCFDPDGWLRLPLNDRMSTLLTPTGLPIEGGSFGAGSRKAGEHYGNPIDELVALPLEKCKDGAGVKTASFHLKTSLLKDMPPGIYRLRFDFGASTNTRQLSLDINEGFAQRMRDQKNSSSVYSPPIRCDGIDARGRAVNSKKIAPRIYWVLLNQYNSNGYWGVIADEDTKHFALSNRNVIHDEIILPLFSTEGHKIAYNLEPVPITDAIDVNRNIPWNYSSGKLSLTLTDPSGLTTDLGTARFKGKNGQGPTTGDARFTSWLPTVYGRYTVTAKGWMADIWGNRYQAGGTYHFWIAKRMTMATATFQGMAYPVGASYGRDIAFFPSVPARVTVDVSLYPYSEVSKIRSLQYGGRATAAGIFGAAQGMVPFVLDTPGEYHAHIQATHSDRHGHLWVCSMRHAGVVYPEDSRIIAHGKKIKIDDQFVARGETHDEGYIDPNDRSRNKQGFFKPQDHPNFINFPYNQQDVVLIASEGQGANVIVPVLTCEFKDAVDPYEPAKLQFVRATNIMIKTSNGMSPHLYPEYITDWEYYYVAAPRPGFSSRFFVGEYGLRGPYWPSSFTNFGEQLGASDNGDLPGDIYRLIGGVVIRRSGQQPCYAGYLASAFILPAGSKNNRVIAPGSEDLIGADGRKARFFLVAPRPGTVYDQNTMFVPFVQIDPVLPAHIRFALQYPDGRLKITEGTGSKFGYFVSPERWLLDQAGVYVYTIDADWEGHKGSVPGLSEEGGFLFVRENEAPGQSGLRLALADQQTLDISAGMKIEGFSSADEVCFTVLMPGAIIDQGRIPVKNGYFSYQMDPVAINRRIPIYDIKNRRTGRNEIGRIIHLTFFSLEKPSNGKPFHSFARVILRGTTVLSVR